MPGAKHLGGQNPLQAVPAQVAHQSVLQDHGRMDDPFQRWEVLSNLLKHLVQIIEPGDIGGARLYSGTGRLELGHPAWASGKRRRGGPPG